MCGELQWDIVWDLHIIYSFRIRQLENVVQAIDDLRAIDLSMSVEAMPPRLKELSDEYKQLANRFVL